MGARDDRAATFERYRARLFGIAALLLHDVFDWSYDEIARTLEKSEAACRQIVHRVVRGAERVAKVLVGYERKGRGLVMHRIGWINGEPAIVTYAGDRVAFVTADTDGERIFAFYRVLDPDKLRRVSGSGGGGAE